MAKVDTLLGVLGALTVSGCGVSSGFLRDATTANQHEYRQEVGGVRYARSVAGQSAVGTLFCAIPVTGGDAPYKDAMEDLHKRASLGRNEVLENIREDHTITAYLGFYCTTVLTISADVIELLPVGIRQLEGAAAVSDSPAGSDSAAPAPGSPSCNLAYSQLGRLVKPFKLLYPNAAFLIPPPAQWKFVDICTDQPADVQQCLQGSYLKANIDDCKAAFEKLSSKDRARLFGVFLGDYE
jgi:hypothetical protein